MSAAKALLFYLQEENRDRIKNKTKQNKKTRPQKQQLDHIALYRIERREAYPWHSLRASPMHHVPKHFSFRAYRAVAAGVGVQCASRENDEPFKLSTALIAEPALVDIENLQYTCASAAADGDDEITWKEKCATSVPSMYGQSTLRHWGHTTIEFIQ